MVNRKKIRLIVYLVSFVLFCGVIYYFTQVKIEELNRTTIFEAKESAENYPYIVAYTSGIISKNGTIKVKFLEDQVDSSKLFKAAQSSIFRFYPLISGEAYWIAQDIIEFRPSVPLIQGKKYFYRINTANLSHFPEQASEFEAGFKVMKQSFDVYWEGMRLRNDGLAYTLSGSVLTADEADFHDVEKMLKMTKVPASVHVNWEHSQNKHWFEIQGIEYDSIDMTVLALSFKGSSIGVPYDADTVITLPSPGDFSLISVSEKLEEDNAIVLQFTQKLNAEQDFTGLVRFVQDVPLRFLVTGNELRVYPGGDLKKSVTLNISAGIESREGLRLEKDLRRSIDISPLKPAVRFVGKGVIVPTGNGITIPFEAVNLRAVDIELIKVYSRNIPQFLQVSKLSGSRELRRVAVPVFKNRILLAKSGVTDLSKWNRFSLDLNELAAKDPGALYEIRLSFEKEYVNWPCQDVEAVDLTLKEEEGLTDSFDDPRAFNSYDSYYRYDFPSDYDWHERDNPCHSSYYVNHQFVSKNLIVSDLGIIAKRNQGKELMVIVTDLNTANPVSNAKIDVLDFQQQVIVTDITNDHGQANFRLQRKPFLLRVTYGLQQGFLKLDDASALPLSNFDVAGESVSGNLKGFVYGNKGVWRPGETIHLSLILEAKGNELPDGYPLILKFYNPMHQLIHEKVVAQGLHGFYTFEIPTLKHYTTGNWYAEINAGDQVFRKVVPIEHVRPNRLALHFSFDDDLLTKSSEKQVGLSAKWLHGASASGLMAEVEMLLKEIKTSFKGFENYIFDDPSKSFKGEPVKVFQDKLSKNGEAYFSLPVKSIEHTPGMLTAYLSAKVFEGGGAYSFQYQNIKFAPYSSFVGFKLFAPDSDYGHYSTGKTHEVQLAVVDAKGNSLADQTVVAEMYKLEWKWWWNQSTSVASNFMSKSSHTLVLRDTIRAASGKAKWSFEVDEEEWGRYFLKFKLPKSGHSSGNEIYLGWPSEDQLAKDGAYMLTVTSDEKSYEVGEVVSMRFPGVKGGRALVSIESGNRLLRSFWVDTKDGMTEARFKVTDQMIPNVYVCVSLIQPLSKKNDLPLRLYGVLPVDIRNPRSKLKPIIRLSQDTLSPNKPVTIRVSEKQNRPMVYTLALIDEGSLGITNFKTPDPRAYFYAKTALGISTWDNFDEVSIADSKRFTPLLSIGGGEAVRINQNLIENRFTSIIRFAGPFFLNAKEISSHTFDIPNYIGAVRVMVVAGYHGAYGSAEQLASVSQPLTILTNVPATVSPGDEIEIPVNIFSSTKKPLGIKLSVKSNDFLEVKNSIIDLPLQALKEKTTVIPLKIKQKEGVGSLRIEARSGKNKAVIKEKILIKNRNPYLYEVKNHTLEPGDSIRLAYRPIGAISTNQALIEFSTVSSLNSLARLNDLTQNPYVCLDQLVSSVFPWLLFDQSGQMESFTERSYDQRLNKVISVLQQFQTGDGGFTYCPGYADTYEMGSNFAGHFLLLAKASGFRVPDELLQKWTLFQQAKARNWIYKEGISQDEYVQAYRLYTLALAGVPMKGAMNRMFELDHLDLAVKWRLASAYILTGQKEAALALIDKDELERASQRTFENAYTNELFDKAIMLEALCLLGDHKAAAFSLMKQITAAVNDHERWISPQTLVYIMLASNAFSERYSASGTMQYSWKVDHLPPVTVSTGLKWKQSELPVQYGGSHSVLIKNEGEGTLFLSLQLAGKPEKSVVKAASEGLQMKVVYKDRSGKPIDERNLKQGAAFLAEVSVFNPGTEGNYQQLVLDQRIPGGWKAVNSRMDELAASYQADIPDYVDIQSDRVLSYFTLAAGERKTFICMLTATFSGKYYLPPVVCKELSVNKVYANNLGQYVYVGKRQKK